jgi:hypothetical protein|tara:strand:- start:272 stop:412 length:141 start_codon:yes stop_codon:yes gene_type:complete
MALYEFPICLAGLGDTPEEAWDDAVEGFILDPGHPDEHKIVSEEDE